LISGRVGRDGISDFTTNLIKPVSLRVLDALPSSGGRRWVVWVAGDDDRRLEIAILGWNVVSATYGARVVAPSTQPTEVATDCGSARS
jgi:hypothetical protein